MADNELKAAKLTGAERSAILLMSLGETDAAAILKHMGPKEVQKVGAAMARTAGVTKEVVYEVVSSFVEEVEGTASLGGSEDYIKSLLTTALGEDKASQVIDRILFGFVSMPQTVLFHLHDKDDSILMPVTAPGQFDKHIDKFICI